MAVRSEQHDQSNRVYGDTPDDIMAQERRCFDRPLALPDGPARAKLDQMDRIVGAIHFGDREEIARIEREFQITEDAMLDLVLNQAIPARS